MCCTLGLLVDFRLKMLLVILKPLTSSEARESTSSITAAFRTLIVPIVENLRMRKNRVVVVRRATVCNENVRRQQALEVVEVWHSRYGRGRRMDGKCYMVSPFCFGAPRIFTSSSPGASRRRAVVALTVARRKMMG